MLSGKKCDRYILIGIVAIFSACHTKDRIPDKITFTEHIAPVLYSNCTICHRHGGNAHFALVTYADARAYASSIAYVVSQHLMPPWPADPSYTHFVGERLLSEHDIQLIQSWVKQGAQQGPTDRLPTLPAYPVGSTIGTPDMRIPVQPYFLKANSSDRFLLIKVPYELPHDTFAAVIEFMPGRHNVVHHVNGDMVKYQFDKKTNVFTGENVADMVEDTTILQAYRRMGLPNDDGSYPVLQKSVVNYLPGVFAQRYPDGIGGFMLPRKGAFLLNDLHYGYTSGNDVWDSSYINIFFTRFPPDRPVQEFQLGTLGIAPVEPELVIQPNTTKHVTSRFTVPTDISILTVNPHMHLLGKAFKAYALKPDKDTIRLIYIPRWDFNWQYFYTYRKMVKIPSGSTIVAEGDYDNTTNNPQNPFHPPQLVRERNGSMKATDEMFQFIVTYLPYKDGDENISLETHK
ncbi:MAG: hypothetical protein H0X33_09245 [Taibaiella sp.]|nr:hypothetical protein [Taibaiella sp.]